MQVDTSTTDPLSGAFIDWCQREHVPLNTLLSHARVLRSIGNAGTATRENVEAWWTSRRDLAPATRANDLANLRAFYKWCQIWEHRADDPTLRIRSPKVPAGLPRPINRADLLTLLDKLPADLRRAACLGAYAGLRVAEAAGLDWLDVDVAARRARVVGKGNKPRLVPLGVILLDNLLPDTGGNVVTAGGQPYAAQALQRKVNRAIRAAGVDATFHQLRHRAGTLAYQETRDLIAVGRFLGHSSPVSTAIYAAASDDALDQIAEAIAR